MSSNDTSTNLPSPQTAMAQPSITSVYVLVDSNEHPITTARPHNTVETEPPLASSAQGSSAVPDPRTSKTDLATETMNPPSPEWNTQTVLQLEHELLFPSPSPPENNTPEPNVQTDASSTEESTRAVEFTEFTLFPEFPPELRLKVWKEALLGPRIVEIEWCDVEEKWFCPIESQSKPSSLLRANKESREVFLKAYTPIAKLISVSTNQIDNPDRDCTHKFLPYGIAYFNFAIDALCIGPSTNLALCIQSSSLDALSSMSWMQNLSILACEYTECYEALEFNLPAAFQLPRLKALIIVMYDVDEPSMRQSVQKWTNRPLGELQFTEPAKYAKHVKLWFDEWTATIPPEKVPKLIVKSALRGGVSPKVVTGERYNYVPGIGQETDDEVMNDED